MPLQPAELSDAFVVEGGQPLSGEWIPAGNKNEALPVLAATLLAPGENTLHNIPRIQDTQTQIALLQQLGVQITAAENDAHNLHVNTRELSAHAPGAELAGAIRGSFLLAPGLLHRTGRARLPLPGGDRIGRRRIDTHLHALKMLGAEVEMHTREVTLSLKNGFQGGDIFLDEASVMATENALMAAAVARGKTRIANAASEPHVQGLCRYLQSCGAQISGRGSNTLEVEGAALQPAKHRVGPDHIEIGSCIAAAAMTGGALTVRGVAPDDLRMILMVFARLGMAAELSGDTLVIPAGQELQVRDDYGDAIPKIDDAPWPGFPTDLSSIALVLATQARGTVLIHEKMFENRLYFVDHLLAMGARAIVCDPHRALVSGPSALNGATLVSPDIRAGMALLAAALCAKGRSVIMNAHQVDRGYENIDQRLRALGAKITRH